MQLSPALQQAIEQISARQGISPEQFIVQTLIEKINALQPEGTNSAEIASDSSQFSSQLRERDGLLVIETASLNHINFNSFIDQLRLERDQEQMCL